MKKKLIIAITAIVMVVTLALVLVGCNKPISIDDGVKLLKEAIDKTVATESYYLKVREKGTHGTADSYIEYRTNIKTNDTSGKSKYNTTQINVEKYEYVSVVTQISNSWLYGYSLSKDIKPKKAVETDYIPTIFTKEGGDVRSIAINKTEEEYWALPDTNGHDIKNAIADLQTIDFDEMDFTQKIVTGENAFGQPEYTQCGITQSGKVTFVRFKVVDETNKLSNYPAIQVTLLNGKISSIMSLGDNEKYRVDIVYQGPKLTTPNYDMEIKEKK